MRQSGSNSKGQASLILNIKDNIHDIFMYKKAYQIHVRKLSEIRSIRKSSLQHSTHRNYQIQHIKDTKHHNFMYKLNLQAAKIDDDNLKLFHKLNKQMNSCRSTHLKQPPLRSRHSFDLSSHYMRNSKQKQLQKQNKRLIQRIKSSQSCISNSKLLSDEKRRQQIRSRIRKFNGNSQLKSQRYFSVMTAREQRKASLSCNLESDKDKDKDKSIEYKNNKNRILTAKKIRNQKIASFYNAQDIFKNKIENYAGIKFKNPKPNLNQKTRPVTIQTSRKSHNGKQKYRSFFPTQTH